MKKQERKTFISWSFWRLSVSDSFELLSKPLKSDHRFFSLQLLPFCLGVWCVFPGQWHSVSWSSCPLCGNPRVSPSHAEYDYSRKLDGAGCSQPSWPGQHPPSGGISASSHLLNFCLYLLLRWGFVLPCQVSSVVTADYELEHLLLEGHCFDVSTGQPPRGLQFTLGMSQDPLTYDTIVMANLVSSIFFF